MLLRRPVGHIYRMREGLITLSTEMKRGTAKMSVSKQMTIMEGYVHAREKNMLREFFFFTHFNKFFVENLYIISKRCRIVNKGAPTEVIVQAFKVLVDKALEDIRGTPTGKNAPMVMAIRAAIINNEKYTGCKISELYGGDMGKVSKVLQSRAITKKVVKLIRGKI